MLRYLLRRILLAAPTLLLISLAIFGVSKCAPGDPVADMNNQELKTSANPAQNAALYQLGAERLGLNKPVFYFNLTTSAYPDSLWKIYPLDRRHRLSNLIAQTGNWPAVRAYDAALNAALTVCENLPDSLLLKKFVNLELLQLSTLDRLDRLGANLRAADSLVQQLSKSFTQAGAAVEHLKECYHTMRTALYPSRHYKPAFHWYGLNNQFHDWFWGFFTGNWGLTKRLNPVWTELKPALYASMTLSGIALFLAFILAIPLGVEMARYKGRAYDRWTQRLLLLLNAMPVFWIGGLLAIFFTGTWFGKPLIVNPYMDVTDTWHPASESFGAWFSAKMPKFALPILVLTLHTVAFIAMQMRAGVLETLQQDYIRTARAKGLDEEAVHWRHAFRNALFPIITLFGSVWPALFTGSLVVESIFNFPGLGLKTQSAFLGHDLVVLSTILMAAATMTIAGNLVADILYAIADPRVRLGKTGG